jgi:heme a synthase
MRIHLNKIVLIATLLTFAVIVLGSYTRLKDAGLGCPDWPGCYGHMLAPQADTSAWIEMIHRYVAGTLGLLILYTFIRARSILTSVLLSLVVFQALLGMWTVTLRLYPIVVMGHLLGGFTILAVLWLLYLCLTFNNKTLKLPSETSTRTLAILATIALVMQIALGGWTSSNYAALVCTDFPTCQGKLWPAMDWQDAFNFRNVGIFDSPGTPLENTARVTIQMAHRIGALVVFVLVSSLCYQLWRSNAKVLRTLAKMLIVLLFLQVTLGIANVLLGLPIIISLAHSAVAAILLICLISILYFLNDKKQHRI